MFTFIIGLFRKKVFIYSITQSREQFIDQLDALFAKDNLLRRRPAITGQFIQRPTRFSLQTTSDPFYTRRLNSPSAVATGVISGTVDGNTRLELTIRPNSFQLFLFFLFITAGSLQLIISLAYTHSDIWISGLFMLLVAAPAMLGFAWAGSNSLRSGFEKGIGIRPV